MSTGSRTVSEVDVEIAIVGGGIGGLALAAVLERRGLSYQVYEQAPALGEVGAGIQLAPNASRLLHRLGLAERLRDHAVRTQAMELRRWRDDEALRRIPLGAEAEHTFGAPYYTVHRADLHAALSELIPPERVRLGRRLAALRERADHVTLTFTDGSGVRAAAVVGADGIRSTVREHLVADRTRQSGQSVYRAVVPAANAPASLAEPAVRIWLGPGRHCVCYPVHGGESISLAATAPAVADGAESWTAGGRVEDLLAAYQGWNERVTGLLGAATQVSRWALHDRAAIKRWSTDRVTILGDAAHPMLPFMAQGANQAIEDAVVLAGCLRPWSRLPGDSPAGALALAEALRRYASLRIQRTSVVQRVSRANTRSMHVPDGSDQRDRDSTLAGPPDARLGQWLYGFDAEAEFAAEASV